MGGGAEGCSALMMLRPTNKITGLGLYWCFLSKASCWGYDEEPFKTRSIEPTRSSSTNLPAETFSRQRKFIEQISWQILPLRGTSGRHSGKNLTIEQRRLCAWIFSFYGALRVRFSLLLCFYCQFSFPFCA